MAAEESLLSWISEIGRKELTRVSEWMCDPSVIRQTERIEFTDLTNVNHEIRTELSEDIWPLSGPRKDSKGLIVLGFMRRGIPLQHTELRMFRAGNEYPLTRLRSEDTEYLALALLDNIWLQCGQAEIRSPGQIKEEKKLGHLLEPTIPRPFEMPSDALFERFDGKQKYASRFWREFLGIGNRNVNADWALLHSRFKIRESYIANELFRHPIQGQPKWSVERALLAKLAARLAYSYIAAAWVPPDACDGEDAKGPTEVRFKFQERVLSPAEQVHRVRALRRRSKKSWERSLSEVVEGRRAAEDLQTHGARLRAVPETYLGLLDPALDDPDDYGPMPKPYEPVSASGTERRIDEFFEKETWGRRNLHRLKGFCHWSKDTVCSALRVASDNSGRIVLTALWLLAVIWLSLNAWQSLAFELPPEKASWPARGDWPGGIDLAFTILTQGIVLGLLIFGGAFFSHKFLSKLAPHSVRGARLLGYFLVVGVGLVLCGLGIVLLVTLLLGGDVPDLSVPLSMSTAVGIGFLAVDVFFIGWAISGKLAVRRRSTVVFPTWNSGRTAPIHEVSTPQEFSVWQGVLVRPSNRARSWKTRPAVELGRNASFWWQDPSDRGHVPGFVPGRPHLMIMELRARLSRDLTLFGFLLCLLAALLLAVPALIMLSDPGLWGRLQDAGADTIVTVLLLLPTAGGALLVRPGEDPIAANLLRGDRLAVGIGAVLMSAIGAISVLLVGWPELGAPDGKAGIPSDGVYMPTAFWAIWLVLGTISLCFAVALFRGYRHTRHTDQPQPDTRQGAVSESRRNPLDIPAPLPPVSSLWGRLFARRTLLRLVPKRGMRKVSPLYHLLLPAEGSRIYTPSSPTILCLVRGRDDESPTGGLLEHTGRSLSDVLEAGRAREDPIYGTNDIAWVASRSLGVMQPLGEVTTTSLNDPIIRERERILLHLLRLQQANSRPNSKRPFGNGGGFCLLEIDGKVFDGLRNEDSHAISHLLNNSCESSLRLGESSALLQKAQTVISKRGLCSQEEVSAAINLREALNRVSLDFDGLVLLDPGEQWPEESDSEESEPKRSEVCEFKSLSVLGEGLSQEAAKRARQAGTGVGAHPWPSSLESPLAGESEFWKGTLRAGTLRSLRLPLLQDPWRFWPAVDRIQQLVFDHGIRTIPASYIGLGAKPQSEGQSSQLGPKEKMFFDWIEAIPRVYSRVFARGRFPSLSPRLEEDFSRRRNLMFLDDKANWKCIDAWSGPLEGEQKIVYVAGNVGSGKTVLAHKVRQKLAKVDLAARHPGQRWEHISPYERHNIFFQLLNVMEPRQIDEEERNYAQFGPRHGVRREHELLMQQTFLIEVAARLDRAVQDYELDGLLVEYWPEMSVEVMGRVALTSPGEPLSEEYRDLKERLDAWKGKRASKVQPKYIVMPAEEVDILIERNAKRKSERRNEKIDSKFTRLVEGHLRELLEGSYSIRLKRVSKPIQGEADPGEWRKYQPIVGSLPKRQPLTTQVLRNVRLRPYPSNCDLLMRPLPWQYVWPKTPKFVVIVDVNRSFSGGMSFELAKFLKQ